MCSVEFTNHADFLRLVGPCAKSANQSEGMNRSKMNAMKHGIRSDAAARRRKALNDIICEMKRAEQPEPVKRQ